MHTLFIGIGQKIPDFKSGQHGSCRYAKVTWQLPKLELIIVNHP
jgi:hypothetical protein